MRQFVIVFLLAATAPAIAADSGPETRGRYTFVPSASGVFRLDSASGEVSLCMERGGALVCVASPRLSETAARSAPRDEGQDVRLAELEARIAALEARPVVPPPSPGHEAIGKVKVLAERMVGRVVVLVKRMKGEATREAL